MSLDHDSFIDLAYWYSTHSTCDRRRVGAVISKDRRIISTGYNGAPAGMSHCYHKEGDDRPCEKSVHAEANAIAFAAKAGISVEGTVLYTTTIPCYTCSALIINAGIKEVRYAEIYRDERGLDILREAGVEVERSRGSWLRIVCLERADREGLHPDERPDPETEAYLRAYGYSG